MLSAAHSLASLGLGWNAVSAALPALCHGLRTAVSHHAVGEQARRFADKAKDPNSGEQWHWMVSQGHKVGLTFPGTSTLSGRARNSCAAAGMVWMLWMLCPVHHQLLYA
jgi:hypothetical protein